jgi:hypothetical protein
MKPLKRKQGELRICERAYEVLSQIDYPVSSRALIGMLIRQKGKKYRSNSRLPYPEKLTRMLRRDNRFRESHCQRGDTSQWEV